MAPDAEVATRIRTALAQHLKRDVSKVRPQDDLRKDLSLDSLAMIELLFKIEEAFDLEIPNEDLFQIATVGDVIGYVERRLGAPAPGAAPASPVAPAARPTSRGRGAKTAPGSEARDRGQAGGRGEVRCGGQARARGCCPKEEGNRARMTPVPASPGVSLEEVAALVDGRLVGPGAAVSGVSSLDEAAGDLAYVDGERLADAARASRAAAFLVGREIAELERPQIVVANPRHAFARVVERFFTSPRRPRGIADQISRGADVEIGPDPSIWPFVTLGNGVRIGASVTLYPGVFIGDGRDIGDDSVLHPRVTVRDSCAIGRRVIVHSGTVIGSDGFGYVQHEGRHHKIPQLGTVPSRTTWSRRQCRRRPGGVRAHCDRPGRNRQPRPDRPQRVDRPAQHHRRPGRHRGQHASGLARDDRRTGRPRGPPHIADGIMIAARAGVIRSIDERSIVSGTPPQPHDSLRAQAAHPAGCPSLGQQLRHLARPRRRARSGSPRASAKTPGKPAPARRARGSPGTLGYEPYIAQ